MAHLTGTDVLRTLVGDRTASGYDWLLANATIKGVQRWLWLEEIDLGKALDLVRRYFKGPAGKAWRAYLRERAARAHEPSETDRTTIRLRRQIQAAIRFAETHRCTVSCVSLLRQADAEAARTLSGPYSLTTGEAYLDIDAAAAERRLLIPDLKPTREINIRALKRTRLIGDLEETLCQHFERCFRINEEKNRQGAARLTVFVLALLFPRLYGCPAPRDACLLVHQSRKAPKKLRAEVERVRQRPQRKR